MKNVKAILFAEGFVSVSLQFLFMRHLLPQVGSSVVVSTIIVSIFLLFLSVGYHFGGKAKDNHAGQLSKNILLSAAVLSIGLSSLVSELFFAVVSRYAGLHLTLAFYLIIFMAPAVFWLGQTMPLLANLVRADSSGKVSATVLFFSTIGNVIGSLISVLILMRYFGLGVTSLINIGVLLGLYLVLSERRYFQVVLAALVGVMAYGFIYITESTKYDKTNQYANYKVISGPEADGLFLDPSRKGRVLIGNNLPQSIIGAEGDTRTSPYIEFIQSKISRKAGQPKDILVLGSGGFTAGLGDEVNKYVYVDIDDQIKEYAEKYFLRGKINGTFQPDDARKYLIEHSERQDVILLDSFHSRISIPQHLMTQEYFQLVKDRVKDNGLVIINTVQAVGFSDEYSYTLNNTINSVFQACTSTEIGAQFKGTEGLGLTNLIYVCYNTKGSKNIFGDDRVNLN